MRPDHRFQAAVDSQPRRDAPDVVPHGFGRDPQRLGDMAGRFAGCKLAEHCRLPWREMGRVGRRRRLVSWVGEAENPDNRAVMNQLGGTDVDGYASTV